jgi:AcrR family transcriptional regulator
VRENQRLRLLAACAEVLMEAGYAATTVTGIARAAGVSKATFYSQFSGLADCVLAAHEAAADAFLQVARSRCGPTQGAVLDGAVADLAGLLEEEQALAHLLADLALTDLPEVAAARAAFESSCARLLSKARDGKDGSPVRKRFSPHLVRGALTWLSLQKGRGIAGEGSSQLAALLAVL